ncbi:MAG: smtA [Puniceicoccaceae bacterium 5H]|nr:MAG: smtA [Puniceicoccaceae bacterium 5H]
MSVHWEKRYQAGHHPWDKGQPAPPLVEALQTLRPTGRILVPGCGKGHDARALAGPGNQVWGVDLAPSAVQAARQQTRPGGSLAFHQGDVLNQTPGDLGRFDWIVEHTCFCAIPPRERSHYVRQMAHLLRPGGCLLGIFFLYPPAVSGPPFGALPQEVDQLFRPFFHLERRWSPGTSFAGREGAEEVRLYRRPTAFLSPHYRSCAKLR